VPLGEERELYHVEIADGSGAVLGREPETPEVILSTDEQMAAFGTRPGLIAVTVAQVSPVWGAGTPRAATFSRPAWVPAA
jgi:hypothetical protein